MLHVRCRISELSHKSGYRERSEECMEGQDISLSEELIRLDELGATREDLVAWDRRVWQVNICQADEDSARDELH